jgi:amicyanin
VKVGTKVTWTNQDSVGHDVVADTESPDAPKSDLLRKGESYSFTFNKAGTYTYYCSPHPYMKGTVIVE